jgi:hypothetical protein
MFINQRSTLSLGYVTPLAGPHPYNYEMQLLFNGYYGSLVPPFLR